MFRFVAPFYLPTTTMLLPNPQASDAKRLRASLQTFRTIDATLYTYVKTKNKKHIYLWDFMLTRNKGLEFSAFYKTYSNTKIICYWDDDIIIGYFKNNPLETTTVSKAGGFPGGELVRITIEFEEA